MLITIFVSFIPLHHAALGGNGEIVMALMEFSTDVNAKDKKGGHYVIRAKSLCWVKRTHWLTH